MRDHSEILCHEIGLLAAAISGADIQQAQVCRSGNNVASIYGNQLGLQRGQISLHSAPADDAPGGDVSLLIPSASRASTCRSLAVSGSGRAGV